MIIEEEVDQEELARFREFLSDVTVEDFLGERATTELWTPPATFPQKTLTSITPGVALAAVTLL